MEMGLTALAWLPAVALVVALVVDRLFGEPPAWAHPVVAMGRWLALFKGLCDRPPAFAFIGGALAWLVGAAFVVAIALLLETALWRVVEPWRGPAQWALAALLLGLVLKPMLAWRMLRDEVVAVEAALGRSVDEGRERLSRLVSRDTHQLSAVEVRETAIETLAENLNDSVIAPLFWFVIAGLPGAALYRFANTADAMWGYRGRWEWAGKWAARADDLLSWIPARLTALAMIVARPGLLPALAREARRTSSPNGGWPMGAMALRLDRRLTKPGHYQLNNGGSVVRPGDIDSACRIAASSMTGLAVSLALAAALLRGAP